MATINSICIQPLQADYENRYDRFLREPQGRVELVAGRGIRGDRKARPGGRQLNLLDTAWLQMMAGEGFAATPGHFGEQLIIEGLNLLALPGGQRLRLGASAVIELTMPRDGCVRLQAAQNSQDPRLLGHIGQLARVLEGGSIAVGDSVELIEGE